LALFPLMTLLALISSLPQRVSALIAFLSQKLVGLNIFLVLA
jgi:hypothetical protein